MRSADVVRAVADGRLDFGIVREDAVPAEIKRWKLGAVGYALFGSKALLRGCSSAEQALQNPPESRSLGHRPWHCYKAGSAPCYRRRGVKYNEITCASATDPLPSRFKCP